MVPRINPRPGRIRPNGRAWLGALLASGLLLACTSPSRHPLAGQEAFRQGELASRQARSALARGELVSARQLTEQARQHYQRLDAHAEVIDSELTLVTLALRQNDLPAARAGLAGLSHWQLAPAQQLALAERQISLALRESALPRAADWLAQAWQSCPAPCARAPTLSLFAARLAAAQGQPERARQLAEAVLQQGEHEETATAHRLLGGWQAPAQAVQALVHFQQALERDRLNSNSAGLLIDLQGAAQASQTLGQTAQASEYRQRAAQLQAAMAAAAAR